MAFPEKPNREQHLCNHVALKNRYIQAMSPTPLHIRLLACCLLLTLVGGLVVPAVAHACAMKGTVQMAHTDCCGKTIPAPPPCHGVVGEAPAPVSMECCRSNVFETDAAVIGSEVDVADLTPSEQDLIEEPSPLVVGESARELHFSPLDLPVLYRSLLI
jgi:hypothetical protein